MTPRVSRFRCSAWARQKMLPISCASSPRNAPGTSPAPRSISTGGSREWCNTIVRGEQGPSARDVMPLKRQDSPNTARLTPTDMMQQYRRIKAQYQDAILLFRFGDFYEMFCE